MAISKELLDILACPKCKSDIQYDEEQQKLICLNSDCGLRVLKLLLILVGIYAQLLGTIGGFNHHFLFSFIFTLRYNSDICD